MKQISSIFFLLLINTSLSFAYDFSYTINNPSSPTADDYIISATNAVLKTEANYVYWKQDVGAATMDGAEPGTIIYHFALPKPVAEAKLFIRTTTFHWTYSQGHSFIYASTDGSNWIKLAEATPPVDNGGYNIQYYNDLLPASFSGSKDIWLKVELNSYGPSASYGGAMTNTAQHSRYDTSQNGKTLQLDVNYQAEQVCSASGLIIICTDKPSATPVKWDDNGHYYEVVEDAADLSWEGARDWASGLSYTDSSGQLFKGHLATITSLQEAIFLETLSFTKTTYLLGGYQTPATDETTLAEMKADWHWVTGEAWDFTDWRPSEPNNFFRWFGVTGAGEAENYLQYLPLADDRGWNDAYTGIFIDSDGEHFFGSRNFIIEYEAVSEPEPEPVPEPAPTPVPQPSCSTTYINLCLTASSCQSVDANWCEDKCQTEACSKPETIIDEVPASQLSEDNITDSNNLFDFAESFFPQYFSPAGVHSFETDYLSKHYLARYYSHTNTYLGTSGEEVYVYGAVFGGLLHVGKISDFILTRADDYPFILGITTEVSQNTRLDGVLAANKTAVVSATYLAGKTIKILVNTENGEKAITPVSISEDKQSLSFVVPSDIIDGNLTLQGSNYIITQAYTASYTATPYITSLSSEFVRVGDSVVITGVNLPAKPVQLVFEGANSVLTQSVTPLSDKVSFIVPDKAESGSVYLQIAQLQTNHLNLSVKRTINAQVQLGDGLNMNAGDISFILGLKEFPLNSSYSTELAVENNDLQYLHAMVDVADNETSILYSAVVLPDMSGTITIDAKSTAIAWIFMGMGTSVVSEQEQWRSIYNKVAANEKVNAFADYIDNLQKSNFNAWSIRSDSQLKSSYQEALKDVIQNGPITKNKRSLSVIETDSGVIIEQAPANDNITIDPLKLEGGNVTLINDTKLFISVEVRDKENKQIVENYKHVQNALGTDGGKLIGPKGWGSVLFGISSAETLELSGDDSTIELITAAWNGETDKGELSDSLRARVFVEGVAIPAVNMVLMTIMDKQVIKDKKSTSRFLEAMEKFYAAGNATFNPLSKGFLKQLMTKVSKKETAFGAIVDNLVIMPITSSIKACAQLPPSGSCVTAMQGVAILLGYPHDPAHVVDAIMITIAQAIEKRIFKKSLVLIPVAGWITQAAFLVYDNIGYVTNTATIAESLIDMNNNTKEINIDVEFPLEITKVLPECVAFYKGDDQIQTFLIQGDGFVASDNREPVVSIGYGADKILAQSLSLSSSGTEMSANFDFYDLMLKGSREEVLQVTIDSGYWVDSPSDIRLVTSADEVVYFDSISPLRASLGSTVTLNGCGWVPLDDIEVTFPDKDGNPIKAEILSKNIEQIKVVIPDEAVSGYVYVNAGYKSAHRFFHLKFLNLSGASVEKLTDKLDFELQGYGLVDTVSVYFVDHKNNRYEASISGITDNSISTSVPDGLAIGPVRISVELKDGDISNELILPRMPETPTANPGNNTTYDEESISVTLSVKSDGDIYYRLNDETSGEEFKYSAPLNLKIEDSKYENIYLYAYARVVVDGVDYDSDAAEFIYAPSVEEPTITEPDLETGPSVGNCPIGYDPSLDSAVSSDDGVGAGYWVNGSKCIYEFSIKYYGVYPIKGEYPYLNGELNGLVIDYYKGFPPGRVSYTQEWVDGVKEGNYTVYDESGNMTKCDVYEDGSRAYDRENSTWITCMP